MLRRPLAALFATLCLMSPASAQQDDIARFVALKTAQAIDDKCLFYKQFERDRIGGIESDLLARIDLGRKISAEDYQTQFDALVAEAKAKADAVGCTDNAGAAAYIMPLRGEAAPIIYADLMIAVQSGQLTPEQTQAARVFESLIQPLYGQNWPGFLQYAHSQAQLKLEAAKQADIEDSALGGTSLLGAFSESSILEGFSGGATFGDYSVGGGTFNFDFTVQQAVRVVDDILFEIIAEQNRLRLIKKHNPKVMAYLTRLTDADRSPVADVWIEGSRYPTLEDGPSIYAVFTLQPDGSARVMTYGSEAARLADGSVTLLVHPKLSPEMDDDFSYARGQEWWDAATAYEGTRIEDACLGGPCFSLPAEAIEAILVGNYGQDIRFFFSTLSDPEMPPPTDLKVQITNTNALFARRDFLAAESP